VTVAEVARQAQVAAATVFNYFPTKEDLYSKLEAFEARLLEAIATRAAGEPVLGCGNHRGVGQVLWPLLEEPVLDQPFKRIPPAMPGRGPTTGLVARSTCRPAELGRSSAIWQPDWALPTTRTAPSGSWPGLR
jgi:AcrR family transcriptional regulator